MKFGTPWEIVRPEFTQSVELYGKVENIFDDTGRYVPRWVNTRKIVGVPYDIPIPGYGTHTVNFLRLWESRPSEKINLEAFNRGGYSEALAEKMSSETVSKVLYPNDKSEAGKSCGSFSNTSSSRARCATSSAGSASSIIRGRSCRTRWRSS